MKIGNRTARAVIVSYGYKAFCEFRRMRRGGWGMQDALVGARGTGLSIGNDDDDDALGFDVVGSAN